MATVRSPSSFLMDDEPSVADVDEDEALDEEDEVVVAPPWPSTLPRPIKPAPRALSVLSSTRASSLARPTW